MSGQLTTAAAFAIVAIAQFARGNSGLGLAALATAVGSTLWGLTRLEKRRHVELYNAQNYLEIETTEFKAHTGPLPDAETMEKASKCGATGWSMTLALRPQWIGMVLPVEVRYVPREGVILTWSVPRASNVYVSTMNIVQFKVMLAKYMLYPVTPVESGVCVYPYLSKDGSDYYVDRGASGRELLEISPQYRYIPPGQTPSSVIGLERFATGAEGIFFHAKYEGRSNIDVIYVKKLPVELVTQFVELFLKRE